ncbi:MAG: glycosyltransferase family 9 protein [Bdellovibrionales bacterium]
MDILFITSNRLGDAILSTGVLRALGEHYHNANHAIACGPHAAELFRAAPGLQRLLVLRKQPFNRHWLELWQSCVGTRWDVVVDLRNSVVSRLLWARQRAVKGRSTGQHKVLENAQVLTGLGWQAGDVPPAPYLWLDEEARAEADSLLRGRSGFLALAPSANWPCKQWPVEKFAELAQRLTAVDGALPDAPILIAAAPNERGQVEPLLRQIPEDRRIDLIGRPLLTVAACFQRARLFVGNDSGLMHMAAAVGAPTLGLFGPGQEAIYGPFGPHCAVVRTPESREELLARLPHSGAHAPNLMETLSVNAVEEAVRRLVIRS